MCGLKHNGDIVRKYSIIVTPFVGVWIETWQSMQEPWCPWVTPFVGVWIETCRLGNYHRMVLVTPFVGVWIETSIKLHYLAVNRSHTLRGCVD